MDPILQKFLRDNSIVITERCLKFYLSKLTLNELFTQLNSWNSGQAVSLIATISEHSNIDELLNYLSENFPELNIPDVPVVKNELNIIYPLPHGMYRDFTVDQTNFLSFAMAAAYKPIKYLTGYGIVELNIDIDILSHLIYINSNYPDHFRHYQYSFLQETIMMVYFLALGSTKLNN